MTDEFMDVTMPDGTVITNVPVGTTKEQLNAKYARSQAPETSKLEDLMSDLRLRSGALADTAADLFGLTHDEAEILGLPPARRRLGPLEAGVQAAGSVAGGALDTMGAAFSALVPSSVSEWTADKAEEFFQTEPGRKAAELLMSGQKKWDEFEREHPQLAKTIGSAGNIAAFVVPTPKLVPTALSAKVKAFNKRAGSAASNLVQKTASGIDKSSSTKRRQGIKDLLLHEGRADDYATHYTSSTGKSQFEPSGLDKSMVDQLVDVPEINPNMSFHGNLAAVDKMLPKLSKDVDTELSKLPDSWALEDVKFVLNAIPTSMKNIPKSYALNANDSPVIKRVAKEALAILKRQEGRGPLDMHRARQQFDDAMKINGRAPSVDSAAGLAWDKIRKMMNDHVDEASAGTIQSKRAKLSALITAKKLLVPKARKEANGPIRRAVKRVFKEGHLPTTVGALMAIGMSPMAPVVAGGIAAGTAGYAGGKALTSATARKAYASILRGLDKEIRKGGVARDTLKTMKADRAVILELMKSGYVPVAEESAEVVAPDSPK